jgi:hypothetical protein
VLFFGEQAGVGLFVGILLTLIGLSLMRTTRTKPGEPTSTDLDPSEVPPERQQIALLNRKAPTPARTCE